MSTLELPSPSPSASSATAEGPGGVGARRVRCLVVDDHPAVRIGLKALLEDEPGLVVVDAVSSAEAALSVAERRALDVAVVDYQLGGRSGLWLSRMLKAMPAPPAVLVYSAFSDYLLGAACVVAQADGLVSKAALGSELRERLRDVLAGRTCLPLLPPALSERLRFRLDHPEQAVFGMLSARFTVTEISRTLGLEPGELDAMLWTMLSKLERIDPVPRPDPAR